MGSAAVGFGYATAGHTRRCAGASQLLRTWWSLARRRHDAAPARRPHSRPGAVSVRPLTCDGSATWPQLPATLGLGLRVGRQRPRRFGAPPALPSRRRAGSSLSPSRGDRRGAYPLGEDLDDAGEADDGLVDLAPQLEVASPAHMAVLSRRRQGVFRIVSRKAARGPGSRDHRTQQRAGRDGVFVVADLEPLLGPVRTTSRVRSRSCCPPSRPSL